MAHVGFLRTTYRHYHRGTLPAFVHEDTTAALAMRFAEHLHMLIATGGFAAPTERWDAFVKEKTASGEQADPESGASTDEEQGSEGES